MGERKSKNSGVARSSAQTSLSDKGTTRAPAEDEADDEEGEEDEEQDLRNFRRSEGDTGKSEDSRDDGDDEKEGSPE